MTLNNYPDYLKAQNQIVINLGGIPWMKYNSALIPATAMPVYIELNDEKALNAVKESGAFFIRYTSSPGNRETNWWHMVCKKYNLADTSKYTRSKIRRGLKRLQIRHAEPIWLAENGYECHVKSYERFQGASPMNQEEFYSFFASLNGLPFVNLWVAEKDNELQGYFLCRHEDNGAFMHSMNVTPSGLSDYAAYALIHHVLEHYLNEKGVPVSNGSRSISHATAMQDFLLKFNFEREYSKLHVIYRPDVQKAVRMLFPFRKFIKTFEKFPVIQKVTAVLFQEEIIRRQNGASL
jgi:hypothetical protein